MTDSPWSHVGVVFWLKSIQRVLLLESVESIGVRFAPLSKYLSDYKKGKPYREFFQAWPQTTPIVFTLTPLIPV